MAVDIFSGEISPRDWSLGSDSIGLTVLWRTAKAQLESLKAAVDILNLDISAWYHQSPPKDEDQKRFANTWSIWRDQFYKWYQSNVSMWERMFTFTDAPWSVASVVEQKQGELNTWRHQFETISGRKAFGASQPNTPAPSPSTSLWKWIAIGGGGGLLALYGVKKFNDFRKAFSPL
jgi:hypothetical protein